MSNTNSPASCPEPSLVEVGKPTSSCKFDLVLVSSISLPHDSPPTTQGSGPSTWSAAKIAGLVRDARVLDFSFCLTSQAQGVVLDPSAELNHVAMALLKALRETRIRGDKKGEAITRPIALFCRGMGGIVAQKALLLASGLREYFDIAFRTSKLVFCEPPSPLLCAPVREEKGLLASPVVDAPCGHLKTHWAAEMASVTMNFRRISSRYISILLPNGQPEDADDSDEAFKFQELVYTYPPFVLSESQLYVLKAMHAYSGDHYSWRDHTYFNELESSPIQTSFAQWLTLTKESSTFYLAGKAGSGKTSHFTLFLRALYQQQSGGTKKVDRNRIIVSFFHDDARNSAGKMESMAAMTVFQILAQRPDLVERVRWSYFFGAPPPTSHIFPDYPTIGCWMLSIMATLIRQPFPQELVFALDGLDEWDPAPGRFIERLMACAKDAKTALRLVLCGSSEKPQVALGPCLSVTTDVPFSRDKGRVAFLDREMSKLLQVRRGLEPFSDDLKLRIQHQEMSYLEMKMTMHLMQFSRLRSLPKDLRKLHVSESGPGTAWMYNAVLIEIQSDQNEWILDALTWVLLAVRPLAIEELAVAVAVRSWEKGDRTPARQPNQDPIQELADGISTDLAGDLSLQLGPFWDLDDGFARIRHRTLKEKCVTLFEQTLRLRSRHASLARSCLKYLSLIATENVETPHHSFPGADYLRARAFNFRDYAIKYWPVHYRLGESDEELDRLVLELLRDAPRRRKWETDFEELEVVRYIPEPNPEAEPEMASPGSRVSDAGAELLVAAQQGLLRVVNRLLKPAAKAAGAVKSGEREVFTQDDIDCAADAAVRAGFDDVFAVLCGFSKDGSAPGKSALDYAARRGDRKTVEKLLALHADVTRRGQNGRTPLISACSSGDVDTVMALIDRSDIGAKTANGNTALHTAAGLGLDDIIKLLLLRNPSILHEKNADGSTAVSYAANMGHARALNVLLDAAKKNQMRGPSPKSELEEDSDNDGWTPLHYAARNGFVDISARLCEAGLSSLATTKEGSTPLRIAAGWGHLPTVEFFCQLQIPPRSDNSASLHLSDIPLPRCEPALEMQDRDGDTPLTVAAWNGWTGVIRLLLSVNANSHHRDNDSFTAFQRAAGAGYLDVVKLLFAAAGSEGVGLLKDEPALSHAAANGNFLVADYLLRCGAEVNGLVGMRTALSYAAGGGRTEMVRFLISKGATVNLAVETETSALHFAARNGHLETVGLLVERGALVTAMAFTESNTSDDTPPSDTSSKMNALAQGPKKGYSKRSPLHMAVAHPSVVKFFLSLPEYERNVNICDNSGVLPIHSAAVAGEVESIKALAAAGALINAPNMDGITPLHWAASDGGLLAVQCLLHLGADLGAVDADGWCALHYAVYFGNFKTLECLMGMFEDKDMKLPTGGTLLHLALAAKDGISLDIVRKLIDWGCNVDIQDKKGLTPLSLAIVAESLDAVELLIDKGASFDTMTSDGIYPIHLAATKPKVLMRIIELIAKSEPSKLFQKTPEGATALHLACSQPDVLEFVSVLLEPPYGFDPNAEDNNGNTPVMLCCSQEEERAVAALRALIDKGGQVCPRNKAGYAPLHAAAVFGYTKYLTELLRDPAVDLECRDKQKDMTPLHFAVIQGHVDTCRLLCEKGADVNARARAAEADFSGAITPLAAALLSDDEGTQKAIEYLLTRDGIQVNGMAEDLIPLCAAAARNRVHAMKSLLAHADIDIEARGSDGSTPLIAAACYEKPEAMKLLLDHGANLEQVSPIGRSVLAIAVDMGNLAMVEMLFEKDVKLMLKLSEKQHNGLTPLQSSLQGHGDVGVEKFLVEHGASLSFKEGTTSPVITTAFRRLEILSTILRRKKDLRSQKLGLEELRVAVEILNVELWRRFACCLPSVESEADQDGWHLGDFVRQSGSQEFMALVGPHEDSMPWTLETEPHEPAYKSPTALETPPTWVSDHDQLLTISETGTEIECRSSEKWEPVSVRANHPFLPCGADGGYFEVHVHEATPVSDNKDLELCIALGLCGEFAELRGKLPGWERFTYGFHGDNGQFYQERGDVDGRTISMAFGKAGDVFGCHFDWREGFIEFVVNGKWSERMFSKSFARKLYPVIGFLWGHMRVSVDFQAQLPKRKEEAPEPPEGEDRDGS